MKRVFLITLAVIALLASGCGVKFSRQDWPELGVTIDKLHLERTVVAECCFQGYIRTIQLGEFEGKGEPQVAAIAQTGVYLFDAVTLGEKAVIDYLNPDGSTLWFGLSPFLVRDKDGFKIAKRGGGFGNIGLLDRGGKELWKFKPDPALPPSGMVVDDSIFGEPRFYVCDRGILYKLDADGRVVWKIPDNGSYITLVRDDASKEAGVATVDSDTKTLRIWSAAGKLEQRIDLPAHPDGIEFVRNGKMSGFVVKAGSQIAFIDRNGQHRWTHSYGTVPIIHGPVAVLVRLSSEQLPLLAVRFASRSATGKSVLSMFSLDGTHLYEEYLDGGTAIGIAPAKNGDRERLLVGEGTLKLWAYESAQ